MMRQQKREIVEVARKNIRMVDTIKVKELLSELNYEDNEELEIIYSEWIEDELSELLIYLESKVLELKYMEGSNELISNIKYLIDEIKSPQSNDIRLDVYNMAENLDDIIDTFENSSDYNTSQKNKSISILAFYKVNIDLISEADKTLIKYRKDYKD